jgi:P27 family predicted phage terminase small subunit
MKKFTIPEPPKKLSPEARGWWIKINEAWEVVDGSLLVLENALEAFDRMRQAQAIIEAEGIVTSDRFGQVRQHPATIVERDAKQTLLRHLKALNLDLEPILKPGRPGGK